MVKRVTYCSATLGHGSIQIWAQRKMTIREIKCCDLILVLRMNYFSEGKRSNIAVQPVVHHEIYQMLHSNKFYSYLEVNTTNENSWWYHCSKFWCCCCLCCHWLSCLCWWCTRHHWYCLNKPIRIRSSRFRNQSELRNSTSGLDCETWQ